MPRLIPTEAQRQKLKQPLGKLITGSSDECNLALKKAIETEKPARLLLIGDTVSRNAVQTGIRPNVTVIDQKEMRNEAEPFTYAARHVFRTTNRAGTIDLGAWKSIEEATAKGDSLVTVEGEEDLLTLVAILVSPIGSLVVYGQPQQGIVLVRVSANKKKQIERIIKQMERAG